MNSNQEWLKVALYVRVSSEEQKQGHNIDSQIAELKQFAAQREWPVVDVYSDEAWSGAALARPALDRLRDDARKKLFEAVLINDVDRLARDVTHLGIIKRDLERSGVRVIFRKIPSENSPTHNLLVNILGSFAEFEREMIMDRTRRGRRHKVETRQQFIGALAPFGYRYIPATPNDPNGQLVINPEESVLVQKMFQWVDNEGLSARDVAARLTREGFRPRKGGRVWQRSSVLRVLRGTAYIGTWYYNKHQVAYRRTLAPEVEMRGKKTSMRKRPRKDWIPVALPDELKIVSSEQWQRVQQQLDRNFSFSPRNSKHQYLLSGLVQCGGCQSSYCGNPSHGKFGYRCIKRCKRVPQVAESTLDNSVWDALKRALDDPELIMQAVEGIQKAPSKNDKTGQLQSALEGIKDEEKRIIEAYRLNILTPDQLAREMELLAGRRAAIEREREEGVDAIQTDQPLRLSVEEYCTEIRRKLANLTFESKRHVLRLLVRRVVFDGEAVRILGVIPLPPEGGIAPTGIYPAERNLTVANFVIRAPIVKDLTAVLAANRANLVKANEALRLRRSRREEAA